MERGKKLRVRGAVMPVHKRTSRINKDLQKSISTKDCLIDFQVVVVNNNLEIVYFVFRINNKDSAYYEQIHVVKAKLIYGNGPEGKKYYPIEAPLCSFLTPMWHTNVSRVEGSICLDVLRDNWSPTYTFSTIIDSIRALLDDPNPNSPFNSTAGDEIKSGTGDDGRPKIFTTAPKYYNDGIKKLPDMVQFMMLNYNAGVLGCYDYAMWGEIDKTEKF